MAKEICVKTSKGLICTPVGYARTACGLPDVTPDPLENFQFPNQVTSLDGAMQLMGGMAQAIEHAGFGASLDGKFDLLGRMCRLLFDPSVSAEDSLVFTVLEKQPSGN